MEQDWAGEILEISHQINRILRNNKLISRYKQCALFKCLTDCIVQYVQLWWIGSFGKESEFAVPGKELLGVLKKGLQLLQQFSEKESVNSASVQFYHIFEDVERYSEIMNRLIDPDKLKQPLTLKQLRDKLKSDCSMLQNALNSERTLPSKLPRFTYAELSITGQDDILGKGRYGSVYKGIHPIDGSIAAVKVMHIEVYDHFLAELTVIGRLKHKNIVDLRGYGYEDGKLILVYDYMPYGSLDRHLFSANKLLSWRQRYEIVKGVAEGLVKGLERRIVHRDVKAANVLLDSKFMARLGDFGISKLVKRTISTLTQEGSWGYIAPELAFLDRAGEKSDVYSFGILLLEIACGKSVFGVVSEYQEYGSLEDWVWEAQCRDELLAVVDPKIDSNYDLYEVRVVLSLGLLCSHPNPDLRPTMRECIQILNYEAGLPDLPNSKPIKFLNYEASLPDLPDSKPITLLSYEASLPYPWQDPYPSDSETEGR